MFFLVEKWYPPTRLESAEIGQKTKEILGLLFIPSQIPQPWC